jgi:hypothetical protein
MFVLSCSQLSRSDLLKRRREVERRGDPGSWLRFPITDTAIAFWIVSLRSQ